MQEQLRMALEDLGTCKKGSGAELMLLCTGSDSAIRPAIPIHKSGQELLHSLQ